MAFNEPRKELFSTASATDARGAFNGTLLPQPRFSFKGLDFFESQGVPRHIYRGVGSEKILLPGKDEDKGPSFLIIRNCSGEEIGAVSLHFAKRIATHLFVVPEAREKKYASIMVEAIEDYAQRCGWKDIRCHVPEGNEGSLAFLGARGWADIGSAKSEKHGKNFHILRKTF
jgi:GNAT superfamily N-acetyltransferase